jgi:tripartite ATP-independent transporter DctM subunit
MESGTIVIILLGLLGAFLIIGAPIGFAILLSSCVALFLQHLPFSMAALKMVAGADSFLLTAIPFFILAGVLMRMGGVTQRIINFCLTLMGAVRGALGHVNILASMIFGGISGSSVADTASIGSILIPEMIRKNYPRDVSAAITAASSTIGIIIPPSIPMILYAMVTEVSIGRLFLAGAIPGILVGLFMMVITAVISAREGYGKEREKRASIRELIEGLRDGILALTMPVVIIGGIVLGVVTATEAAALAVGYGFVLGFFVYRELKIADLKEAFLETVESTAVVMLIVVSATLLGWILAYGQIPQKMTEMLLSVSSNPIVVLLIINGILLIVGTFSDLAPNILILTPIFFPVILKLGIDPVHFGIVVVANQAIALVTPPVGNCLYICSNLAKVPIERLLISSLPYLLSNLLVLLLVTFFPRLVLFLPSLLMP